MIIIEIQLFLSKLNQKSQKVNFIFEPYAGGSTMPPNGSLSEMRQFIEGE